MEHISLLDLVSIALILFLGIKGIFRGFVKEVFGLVGIIGGIYVASRYAETAGRFLDANFLNLQNKGSLYLIGFIAVLIAFWLFAVMIGFLLGRLVNSSGLGLVDKLLGFFVGGAKVFLIFSVIIYVFSNIGIFKASINNLFAGSMMYPIFQEVGAKIVKIDPSQINMQDSISVSNDEDKEDGEE
ncbi:MAG: CvpA family protein [Sulfurospirillum sp.]|nr:MAG: CvpA family protein [Sulfurospirillum sp.]